MWLVIAAVALIVVAGLLAAVDAALSSFSKARAKQLAEENRGGSARLMTILDEPARYLNCVLLMRVVCETAAVLLLTVWVIGYVGPILPFWLWLLIAILAMAFVNYVAIGVGPRTLGRQHAESIALASALPVMAAEWLLGPIPKLLIAIGNALTPGRGFRTGPFASEVELRELVDLAVESEVIESEESRMIQSVFELGDTVVREVMVPRTDLVFIEHTKTLRQTMSLCLRSGYSRIPVIDESLDEVLGMAYLKDVTRRVFDNHTAESVERVESIMRPCLFVPDSKKAADLLREMQAGRTHVAIVVDEYGGTAGMVTIEDIVEEIVGEITDEYDTETPDVVELSDGAYRVNSRCDIDDLAELFDVRIPDEDVDSVGGLLAKHLGMVPIPGSSAEVSGLLLRAEGPTGRRNRIATVHVSRVHADESIASESD
ncbi:MAG TPA: hemolysin family protein [Aeromicrobium sp.]|nr:hemolysin family protein [Aeromicrobium sp.]